MTLRLNGSTSGYTEIDAPATAGNNNLKLPTGNGSDGNILGTDGAGNLSWVNGRMVLETAKASTSGTSVDFTGIPSWVKRITILYQSVSIVTGANHVQIRLGTASGFIATGYVAATDASSSTTGFQLGTGAASNANPYSGSVTFTKVTGNIWAGSGASNYNNRGYAVAGHLDAGAAVDRIQLVAVGDTFDAGSVNILYEG